MGSETTGRHGTRASRGRTGRFAIAARFLYRSLTLRGPSFLLALLAVTTGATVTAVMLNLKADLATKMSTELRRYGPNLLVTPAAGVAGGGVAPTLDERALGAAVASLPRGAGAAFSPLLMVSGSILDANDDRLEGRRPEDVSAGLLRSLSTAGTVVGADFESLRRLYPSWRVEGSWPSGETETLAGASLARRAGLSPGRRVRVRTAADRPGEEFTVSGTVSTGESEEEEIFVPLARLQDATSLSGRVTLAALSVDGGTRAVEDAAAAIGTALPGVSARPLRQIASAQGEILSKLGRMMVLLTTLVLALAALCLTTTLMTVVIEREREIGLMRSIGAGDGQVLAMFVGEVTLLGALGGLLGLGAGAIATRVIGYSLFDAAIAPRAGVVPLVLGCSIALCLLSVLVPLRRALAVQPAGALRGD